MSKRGHQKIYQGKDPFTELWTIRIVFFLFFLSNYAFGRQKVLAGEALFPAEYYQKWLASQQDPNLSDAEKIKATIDTYFNLVLEARKTATLLDFIFLFDKENPKAYDDYVYERGFFNLRLVADKYYKFQLMSYVYHPQFRKLKITDRTAVYEMQPRAELVFNYNPSSTVTSSWTDHRFELIKKNDAWLIQSFFTDEEGRGYYPRDTDFNNKALTFEARQKEYEKEVLNEELAPYKKIVEDPKYKILKKYLFDLNGVKETDPVDMSQIYSYFMREISGTYIIKIPGGKDVALTFSHDVHLLYAQMDGGEKVRVINTPRRPEPLDYEASTDQFKDISPDDPSFKGLAVYRMRFKWNEQGRITECLIDNSANVFRAVKIVNKSNKGVL